MRAVIDYLHEFNVVSVILRLLLAPFCGGAVGYGRSRKGRPAGLRTYMLVAIGAAMSVMITFFDYEMIYNGVWKDVGAEIKFDASRIAAQVMVGIGFLGAGIIIKGAHQQVKGLTTATGLFATVCMGIAAGAGFYTAALLAALITILVLNGMSQLEVDFKRKLRNITINVEFDSVEDIGSISQVITGAQAEIFDIDIERTEMKDGKYPSATFILKMPKKDHSHSGMLSSVAELGCVHSVQELIS